MSKRFEKVKKFVKEHKTEIVIGTIGIGAAAFVGYKYKMSVNETIAKLGNNNDKETKEALEKLNQTVKFLEHENVAIGIRAEDVCDIANRSLGREESRVVFEIEELKNYIANLDQTKNINKFHRIPEKEARIAELEVQLKDILSDELIIKQAIELF